MTYHCLSLTCHCLSLAYHCLSLTCHCLHLGCRGSASWRTGWRRWPSGCWSATPTPSQPLSGCAGTAGRTWCVHGRRTLAHRQTCVATRPEPLQIILIRACLYGRGACADCTLKSAALIKTNPTEWFLPARPAGVRPDSSDPELQHRELHLRGQLPQPVSRHWHARHGLSSDKMALITSDCGTPP